MANCIICGGEMAVALQAQVLGKYKATYLRCGVCGFLRADEPFWLREAYEDPIAESDTGLVKRNLAIAAKLAPLLFFCLDPRGTYVDVAGGYGLLVRLMRDLGFNFFWSDKHCQNALARGFEFTQTGKFVTAVTAFEVLEHVLDPVQFLSDIMTMYGTKTLIFTTELYTGDAAPDSDWWYYGRAAGQHVSFFQLRTLERLAAKLGVQCLSVHGVHIFFERHLRNRRLAHMATSRLALPTLLYISRRLGSKTMADHLLFSRRPR